MVKFYYSFIVILLLSVVNTSTAQTVDRPRVLVTTDGEADDRASMVRFLLTSNEFEVEGIINSSSQFHWEGGQGWNAFHPVTWVKEYIDLYAQVYPNLQTHDTLFPHPDYLQSIWKVGNIAEIGEYQKRTEGAKFIAETLLDTTDHRPIWVQAWGGTNTIASALKIIEEDHPEKMNYVARKLRLFLIWEQDQSYQDYIRPHWEHLNINTIISDQFDCMAYIWPKVLPKTIQPYFEKDWMITNIIEGHGALCNAYENNQGAFNAEGDTPAFLHAIPNGLRSMESPDYGGWGGRYVKVRNNVWMDPLPNTSFTRPTKQWGFENSWSKLLEHKITPEDIQIRTAYFKPIWRWLPEVQNDFAARADWCVKPFDAANHHPIIKLKKSALSIRTKAGATLKLDASQSIDPDGDQLHFNWWHYNEADSYSGKTITGSKKSKFNFKIPHDVEIGDTLHIICEVKDSGTPTLTRYKRILITISE